MSRCLKAQKMIEEGRILEAIQLINAELGREPTYTGGIYNAALAFRALGWDSIANVLFHYYLMVDPVGEWSQKCQAILDGTVVPEAESRPPMHIPLLEHEEEVPEG
jgi:hypothetical protein